MSPLKPIQLGDTAQDTISGFKGTVVCITEWIYGCRRIGIQPQSVNKDGIPIDPKDFDEPQIKIVKRTEARIKTNSGGPRLSPTRKPDARRHS